MSRGTSERVGFRLLPQVRYLAHSPAGLLYFAPGEVVLALQAPASSTLSATAQPCFPRTALRAPMPHTAALTGSALRLHFIGANPATSLDGDERLPGRANYFIGKDPARWRTGLPTYARLTYRQLYPGIDLVYGGASGRLKGTYTVAPGADPGGIRWRYEGVRAVRLDEAGNLEVEWADIVAFRNIAVHAYFAVDWAIVWVAATQDAPELRRRVTDILAKEYRSS